jgi:hypothetical protein
MVFLTRPKSRLYLGQGEFKAGARWQMAGNSSVLECSIACIDAADQIISRHCDQHYEMKGRTKECVNIYKVNKIANVDVYIEIHATLGEADLHQPPS